MESYTVYINYSEKFDKYYIGQTEDFESRLILHNSGLVKSTSPYVPWINVLLIEKSSRSEAMLLEKKLKNLNRIRLIAFIEKYR
jgi:putative endonuclease